jgi:hypothetical protein
MLLGRYVLSIPRLSKLRAITLRPVDHCIRRLDKPKRHAYHRHHPTHRRPLGQAHTIIGRILNTDGSYYGAE